MPTLISPSVNLSNPQAAQAGPRGRSAEEPEGRSFGAMLDRTRAGRGTKSADAADAAPETTATRRPVREGEPKSELSAADVLALLAPLAAPIAAPIVGTPADARLAAGKAASEAAGTGVLPDVGAADASARAATLADGTVAAASQAAVADEASKALASEPDATDDATAAHAAKAAKAANGATAATDPAARTALAQPAADAAVTAASPASAPVPSSFVPPMPAAKAAGAGEAVAAAGAAPTDTPRTAAVQAAAASAAASITVAAEPKGAEPLDADSASGAPALQAFASAMPAAADRAAAAKTATPVLSVAPPVGSNEWGPAIGQQMIRMSASGHQVAELNLNPAGLGPLKVTLTMGDNQAQAMFVSAHEGVRRAVEAALPQLRTTLADQGISLGHTSVGAESRQPSPQGGFAEQNPGRSSGQPSYPGARADVDAASAMPATAPRAGAARTASAGLDTFA